MESRFLSPIPLEKNFFTICGFESILQNYWETLTQLRYSLPRQKIFLFWESCWSLFLVSSLFPASSPTFPYTESTFVKIVFYKHDERDTPSVRCRSSRYQVTGYDKLYEIAQKERLSSYDGGPLFRLEVALFSPGIHYLRTNGYLPDADWLTQLLACGTDGHTIMRYVLNKLLPPGDYFTFEGARQIIRESHFPHPKQNKLCTFLLEINRCEQIDTITIKAHRNGRKRLQQLCELNINPVLINPSTQISCLPSLFPVPCI